MTASDRSKLARIVAHMLALEQQVSAIEKALGSVAHGAELADINRAILEGSEGFSIASLINTEHELTAQGILEEVQGRGATSYHILAHFQIQGPQGPEWRSVTSTAYGRIGPEDIRAAANTAMASYAAHENAGVSLPDEASVQLVADTLALEFVVPQFGQ